MSSKKAKPDFEKLARKHDKKLRKLAQGQDALCRRIEALERGALLERSDAPVAHDTRAPEAKPETLAFLDQFRAGESLGEASLGVWIAVCDDASLRGGLRTVQMREGIHARLLEQRLVELGSSPKAVIPEGTFQAAMSASSSRERSDVEKLADFVARFPDIDEALAPIVQMADALDDDPETQTLLRTICQDERSTLEYLGQACRERNS